MRLYLVYRIDPFLTITELYKVSTMTLLQMCVVSRREAVSMVKYVKEADERAFVIVADAREVLGEGFSTGD